jgi:hypothetical protein
MGYVAPEVTGKLLPLFTPPAPPPPFPPGPGVPDPAPPPATTKYSTSLLIEPEVWTTKLPDSVNV